MRIGLIDVDGRHGKKKWGATVYPNVALGKIARWHTMQGDEVEWAQPTDLFDRHHYDILYASKVFNFSPDIDFRQFSYDRLEKGDTGYDIYKRLPDEIDRLQPLYELFPWVPKNHAYGKLTEGCPQQVLLVCGAQERGAYPSVYGYRGNSHRGQNACCADG